MHCHFCRAEDTKVIDSRLITDGQQVRRRRECLSCQLRFTTHESVELSLPRIKKKDGRYVQFKEEKLRAGILRALEKRPINAEELDKLIYRLVGKMRASGEREISSNQLGEWAMAELKNLDGVAYVRFASVYRHFEDVEAFYKELDALKQEEVL